VARQGFFHVGNTVSVVDFALPTHVGYGATALFGHASRIGTIKRVRFTNFLDTIIIKILNKKGLKIKKNRTAVMAAGAEQAAGERDPRQLSAQLQRAVRARIAVRPDRTSTRG
jgi:hypothetical protein